jgi:hypothetical protein
VDGSDLVRPDRMSRAGPRVSTGERHEAKDAAPAHQASRSVKVPLLARFKFLPDL